ncbi:branched-chain amino acid transport system II carrier protein [Holzapfeliella floricola]|uniref:branched-chain amino acid transport system II carrier protein n=1 Tax=Holzapfeliella floricola TaxID=679249 RepID=UPI001F5C1B4F|nr:branched-chain amino acid transport system II carrier protein [Holzapfeliella floricola]
MKTNHLSLKNTIYIGLLLFGVFFGAGNVIFPISLGQQSGNLLPLSTAGFFSYFSWIFFTGCFKC